MTRGEGWAGTHAVSEEYAINRHSERNIRAERGSLRTDSRNGGYDLTKLYFVKNSSLLSLFVRTEGNK